MLRSRSGQLVRLMPDYVRRAINQASPSINEYQAIQHSLDDIEIRLALAAGAAKDPIAATIVANLSGHAEKAGGRLGQVRFADVPPHRDPTSHKLVRVISHVARS